MYAKRHVGIQFILLASLAVFTFAPARDAAAQPGPKSKHAWTLDQAIEQLVQHPDDPYLQFVVLQIGKAEQRLEQAQKAVDRANRRRWRRRGPERRVDLFSLFTGALAVQESLQLDAMRGEGREFLADAANPAKNVVPISELQGPIVKSHPWGEMLARQALTGDKPDVSRLAGVVPSDQYLILCRSLTKLLEVSDVGDLWGAHLFSQTAHSAKTQMTSQRLKTQLAMQTDPLTRPFYDLIVNEVAITGSDLYFREGSDVTMVFVVKQPKVFQLRMDGFLQAAMDGREDAVRSTGKIRGIDYVHVATPDRAVCVFSAYPEPDFHVRSNSRAGLERILATIQGEGAVESLAETTEYKYIRTLMVRGDEREDVFVYLSDPLIRRLVGPQLKLTEMRRMLCYNHLRMIGHAAMLHRTQYGKQASSLAQLVDHGCAPEKFGDGGLPCPCGGTYSLSADGTGVCSVHGTSRDLVPCSEIPLERVIKQEAEDYRQFIERYSQYWRRFFDPIAIRIQMSPERYRAETIILPLIDNSIYTGMSMALGGEPEPLDALPVPEKNVFSIVFRLNKPTILGPRGFLGELSRELEGLEPGIGANGVRPEDVQRVLSEGVGNQIGMHVYDASPFFDFNLTGFIGEMMREFRGGGFDNELLPVSFLIASLNAPVYLAVPVKDAEIVDGFLDSLDNTLSLLARQKMDEGWFEFDFDFYKMSQNDSDPPIRCYAIQLGPIRWRVFFARIGDGLYLASKAFILEDLAAAQETPGDGGPEAHAMIRVRADHWKEALPAFQLGWAESSREACLNNLGPLSSVARAVQATSDGPVDDEQLTRQADDLHSVHFFCPDGGRYQLAADGSHVECSVHGTAAQPRQPTKPAKASPMGRLMDDFSGVTAELTFLEDGLHAVVTVQKK